MPRPAPYPESDRGRSSFVRAAVRRIVEEWNERTDGSAGLPPEVQEALEVVTRQVEDEASGRPVRVELHERRESLLHFRLLESLRNALLTGWREEGSSGDGSRVLELLHATATLQERVWPDRHDDPAMSFAGPDAYDLVVDMAHDIRSPLNSILFLSDVLRSGHSGPVTEHQASQLGLIYSAALRMTQMAGNVMELARSHGEPGDEGESPFSMKETFESVRAMVRPMAEEKGIRLEFERPEDDRFIGKPLLLARVLLNLVTNALKFTDEGSVTIAARFVGASEVEFSVTDTGKGIQPEKRDQLFDAFRWDPSRTGRFFSVSGLGLSIARRLVWEMGGELDVESKLGEGTRFHFRLELPRTSAF